MGWICFKCFTNNGSNQQCGTCGAHGPRRGGGGGDDGREWRCLLCHNLNPPSGKGSHCVECHVEKGLTPSGLVRQQARQREEDEINSRISREQATKANLARNFVVKLTEALQREDPKARIERMRLHKIQYQAEDLKMARQAYMTKREEIAVAKQARQMEEEAAEAELEAFRRAEQWFKSQSITLPEEVSQSLRNGETTIDIIKEMGLEELLGLGFSVTDAKSVAEAVHKEHRAAAIAAGEVEEEEKKEPVGPTSEELAEQAEQAAKKAEEEKKLAEELAAAAKRAEEEEAARLKDAKQKNREFKQAERREAMKQRQLKLAAEKKKKEELRIAKLKEKAELAKTEARRKEEEAAEAERAATRARMQAFFEAERQKEQPVPEEKAPVVEVAEPEEEDDDEEGAPPVFLSSGDSLTELAESAFQDTGGELRLCLAGLSTSCATIYGNRSKIVRREIQFILKTIMKIYGDNIICTTPLADEIDLISAEICLSLGLQLRAVLPPIRPVENEDFEDMTSRLFNLGAAVASAVGPALEDIHPEYHETVRQRQSRLRTVLSKDKVSVFHIPSREWDVHGYHCVRAILAHTSDIVLVAVDAVPSPTPACLLWDTVRHCLAKKTPMVVVKSHESNADLHSFKHTDKLGRTLLSRYTSPAPL